MTDTVMATPHARGSTLVNLLCRKSAYGYPACAGIDLATRHLRRDGDGLPRMRGDRPSSLIVTDPSGTATPHARGSTHHAGAGQSQPPGYPACAGIDPAGKRPALYCRWLPRMRGDRPVLQALIPDVVWATPHARGSTLAFLASLRRHRGYPACAGIDPFHSLTPSVLVWLPRMRGDRPSLYHCSIWGSLATPHARGSTACPHAGNRASRGYPACAGIDPRSCAISPLTFWLPRMRGDRPKPPRGHPLAVEATPHARGSTPDPSRSSAWPLGYPACAGIDLIYSRSVAYSSGLPRMRGDRPR